MPDSPNDPIRCPKCGRQVSYRVRGTVATLCGKCRAHLTIEDDGHRLRVDLVRNVTDRAHVT